MRRECYCLVYIVLAAIILTGCGETVRGAWKDTKRVGNGIKTIFVCDSARYGE
ncbi:MAG: hypothetical protein JW938_07370 [Candidatus Omnitrophica bacterium]|nr:hypothetical protein [Candidatus Omnitrophota bacterium]